MAKLTLSPLTSGFLDVPRLNANFEAIEDAFDNTLSRDGSLPNSMDASLDMNSHRIVNLSAGVNSGDAVTVGQLDSVVLNYVVQRIEEQQTIPLQAVYTLNNFTYQPGQNNLAVYRGGTRLLTSQFVETDESTITLVSVPVGVENLQFVVNESLGTFGDVPAHIHETSDIDGLEFYTGLDTRYYTETEADALLAAKAPTAAPTFTGTVQVADALHRKNADNSLYKAQPRIFVQAADPGANAAEDDIWMW